MFCWGSNINNIIEQQYYLAKNVNIPTMESEFMFDHEREAHVAMMIRDNKKEKEDIVKMNKNQ